MAIEVIFNNTKYPDNEATFKMIQEELEAKVAFSGSIEGEYNFFI